MYEPSSFCSVSQYKFNEYFFLLKDLTQKIIQLNKYEDAIYAVRTRSKSTLNDTTTSNKVLVFFEVEQNVGLETREIISVFLKGSDRIGVDFTC
jgi:hypothetical protein